MLTKIGNFLYYISEWVPIFFIDDSRHEIFSMINKKISCEFILFDDESTKEKFTVMNKFEIAMDDERNVDVEEFAYSVEQMMEFGKTYKIIIEEVTHGYK